MTSSLPTRQSASSCRLLALLLSWMMLVVALPTGTLSHALAAPANSTNTLSTSSGQPEASAASASQASTPEESAQEARVAEAYGKLPLRFEANYGQVDRQVQFLARGGGYSLFLTPSEAVLVLNRPSAPSANKNRAPDTKRTPPALAAKARRAAGRESREAAEAAGKVRDAQADATQSAVLRMKLEGASSGSQAVGMDELPGKSNYFIGNNPQQWHTDIPSYARVMYREVYPGVDLVYYGREQQLEYDFRVAPGADPSNIRLKFEGAQSMEVDAQGDLVLHTEAGDVHQHKPVVYQEVDGARREISSRYEVKEGQRVGFHVEGYDRSKPLVIDPVLLYSTYLGGTGSEDGFSIAIDSAGNAYVAGRTASNNFPVVNPAQGSHSLASDAFVSKLNPSGSALIYSTYVGGMSTDRALGLAIDAQGSAYITGFTFSSDYPVANALQATLGGQDDPFVTKLSPSGSSLVYSTYLGGSSYEAGFGIATDATGNAYVTGFTYSHDYPVVNPFQSMKAGHQAFRSTDGGGSWNASDSGLNAARLNDLAIDRLHPATLYAASEQGVFKTTDGGGTWVAVNHGIENTGDAENLAVDPKNPSTVFVGTDFGLYRSTNGGDTWAPSLTAGLPLIEAITIDPIHTNIVYTSANGSLYKSTDGGNTWQPSPVIDPDFQTEVFVSVLAVQPNNSSTLYAGTFGSGIYRSTDGGNNWSAINLGLDEISVFGGTIEDLVINPSTPSTIYASANIGGVFKSTDGGDHWATADNGIPDFTGVPTLDIDPVNPNVLYAGTFGSGLFKTTNGGANWSTVNTGLTNKDVNGVVIDPISTSNIYVVTSSLGDAFVTKLNPSGSARLYSTYLGGDEDEEGNAIALDRNSHAYLTGYTLSSNFPLQNPLQASLGNPNEFINDAFVTKMGASGASLDYSTYLGGNGDDVGKGIAVDRGGNAYVTGYAMRVDSLLTFPTTPGAFQTSFQGFVTAFVSKLNAAGSSFVYSTLLGGNDGPFSAQSGEQYGNGIAVNSAGQAFVTGQTRSVNFPLANPIQNALKGDNDAFVTRFNAAGSALIFSTYLGGFDTSFPFTEQGNGIAVDSASSAYVVGTTSSTLFPTTPNAFQKNKAGGLDVFISKIGAPPASIQISGKVLLNGVGLGGVTVTLKNKAGSILQTTTTSSNGSYSFNAPGGGDYTVTPSKPGYTFNPPSRSYTNVGTDLPMQNFEAMVSTFTIFITVDNNLSGVKITLTGSRTGMCTTDANGNCQFTGLPAGGNYTVTPSAPGATFRPASKSFNNLSQDQFVTFIPGLTISGRVTGAGGIGIGGVTIKLNDSRSTVTDSNGNYMFTNLPVHTSYVVTPMKGGMTFNPTSKLIQSLGTSQTVNFQALVSITGKVRLQGTTMGISGVTMKLTGSRNATTTTNADGIYMFSNLPAGGNYTVTPMKTGYTFTPTSRTFTNLRTSQGLRTAFFDGMP